MPLLRKRHTLYLALKLGIFYKIWKALQRNPFFQKYSLYFSLVGAAAIFKLIMKLFNYFLYKAFNMIAVKNTDSSFFYTKYQSLTTVVLTTDHFEFEKMKSLFLTKLQDIERVKATVTDLFGSFYFQDMSKEQWEKMKHLNYEEVTGVHTTQQLEEFLSKALATPIDVTRQSCIKYFMIPKFNETEGRIIIVFDHAIGDGVSGNATLTMTESPPDF